MDAWKNRVYEPWQVISNTVALTRGFYNKIRPLKVVRPHVHNTCWEPRAGLTCPVSTCSASKVSTARYLPATWSHVAIQRLLFLPSGTTICTWTNIEQITPSQVIYSIGISTAIVEMHSLRTAQFSDRISPGLNSGERRAELSSTGATILQLQLGSWEARDTSNLETSMNGWFSPLLHHRIFWVGRNPKGSSNPALKWMAHGGLNLQPWHY